MNIREILSQSPLLPVLTVRELDELLPLTRSLSSAGLKIVEITLRTPSACDAIRALRDSFPNLLIGAGTIIDEERLVAAKEAGAHFCVTPGLTDRLADALHRHKLPCLPGVATPSEVMKARDFGFQTLKLFPASALNGLRLLESIESVFPETRFCPTGGIGENNFRDYLQQGNVICVGGSWILRSEGSDETREGYLAKVESSTRQALQSIA